MKKSQKSPNKSFPNLKRSIDIERRVEKRSYQIAYYRTTTKQHVVFLNGNWRTQKGKVKIAETYAKDVMKKLKELMTVDEYEAKELLEL